MARVAERQHGVISRQQILAIRLDPSRIERWLRSGRLHRLHAGVYAVGHPALSRHAYWIAAVLASGELAVLSHLSAGLLWGLLDRDPTVIHTLIEGARGHRRPGLVVHRTRDLPASHRTEIDGIPVTSLNRTLVDLASVMPASRLRFAVEAADRLGRLDVPSLVALCDASAGRRGVGRLRRIALEQRGEIGRTKSPPERLFLRLLLSRGLPEPLINVRLEGYEVDFLWPHARLVVEVDSYTYHRSWAQQRRDRKRDAHLAVCGYEVLRYVEDELLADADRVFEQVTVLLAVRAERAT